MDLKMPMYTYFTFFAEIYKTQDTKGIRPYPSSDKSRDQYYKTF
jgi:hypothetical protein